MDAMISTADDSTEGTDYEIPDNMDATQTDLPHIRDSPDSTAEPVDQRDKDDASVDSPDVQVRDVNNQEGPNQNGPRPETAIKRPGEPVDQQDIPPRPHGIPASPEQEDISPRPHGVPASPEEQGDIPPRPHGVPASPEEQEDIPPRPHGIPASPEEQEDIPPQPHGVPASPEEREDISSGHAEHPVQDDHSNASAEHSDQDNGPFFSSDNGAGRSSLPTICTSYTQIGKGEGNQTLYTERRSPPAICASYTQVNHAEQNQTLYVDSSVIETEEPPSKNIYRTEDCIADNEVQYQLKGTCRETSAAAYQCGGDVDGASVDRPDIEVENENSEAEDQASPETVIEQLNATKSSDQSKTETTAAPDDDCIRPYAVGYQRDAETNGDQEDVHDVQPYAVAYDEQEGHYETQTPTGHAGTSAEAVDNKAEGLRPNPMYSGNGLRSNPMYVPNAAQPTAGGGYTCVLTRPCMAYVITTGVVVTVMTVLAALITATFMSAGRQNNHVQTTWTEPAFTITSTSPTFTDTTTDDATQQVDNTSSPPTSTAGKGNQGQEQTRIVFGGVGEGPGEFMEEGGLTVSPSSEIFVGNPYKRRVQVFSMTGVYLRQFPAITSTEEVDPVEPADLAMDGEGHLWLIGKYITSWSGVVVRLTKTGEHLATFRPSFHNNSFFGIAVDALREHVVVTEAWRDYSEVKVLHFNGSVVRRFRAEPGPQYPGRVAVGREGNLFVTNFLVDSRVYVYDNTGHFLFSFGGEDFGERQTVRVMDVCTDSSGNVLVAEGYGGTVEMFTQDGRYVRRVAGGMLSVCSVAVAPGGQLVVTDDENSTVSVFSHY